MTRQTRDAVCSIPTYHDTLGSGINACLDVLQEGGFTFANGELLSLLGDAGRTTVELIDQAGELCGSLLVFAWYRMPSGRYEITAYLS